MSPEEFSACEECLKAPRRGDHGSTTPELVVILPLVMLLVTLGLQFGLWALASHALSDSVTQGGAALRADGGTSTLAQTVVQSELRELANGLVLRPVVSIQPLSGASASLFASGTVPSLIPGLHLTVSADSAGPDQQFRASG